MLGLVIATHLLNAFNSVSGRNDPNSTCDYDMWLRLVVGKLNLLIWFEYSGRTGCLPA